MNQKMLYASLRRVLVPVVHGCTNDTALKIANALAPEVVLVGIVRLPDGETLSAGAAMAQALRKELRRLGKGDQVRARLQVLVTTNPWRELQQVIQDEEPDLLIMDADGQLSYLGLTPEDVLTNPPCDVALARGQLNSASGVSAVLVPVRGGPFAELALRIGLNLSPKALHALHIQLKGNESSNAPFQALKRVLERMPEVTLHAEVTDDAARTIIEQSRQVWLAADHSKFNRPAMVELARLHQVDTLYTDRAPPEAFEPLLAEGNVQCVVAD